MAEIFNFLSFGKKKKTSYRIASFIITLPPSLPPSLSFLPTPLPTAPAPPMKKVIGLWRVSRNEQLNMSNLINIFTVNKKTRDALRNKVRGMWWKGVNTGLDWVRAEYFFGSG